MSVTHLRAWHFDVAYTYRRAEPPRRSAGSDGRMPSAPVNQRRPADRLSWGRLPVEARCRTGFWKHRAASVGGRCWRDGHA